mmetsp:Transcript_8482/g.12519  ORF Transcript_8482/g.12519 Transcript_8482/m.12519 type:complete len:123 (+) Transcript_8482:28-396(+)
MTSDTTSSKDDINSMATLKSGEEIRKVNEETPDEENTKSPNKTGTVGEAAPSPMTQRQFKDYKVKFFDHGYKFLGVQLWLHEMVDIESKNGKFPNPIQPIDPSSSGKMPKTRKLSFFKKKRT